MAIISLVIEDLEDGTVNTKFVSNAPLPASPAEYTPAQAFAVELKSHLETANGH